MFDEEHFNKFLNFVFDPSACMEFISWNSYLDPRTNRIIPSTIKLVNGGWFDKSTRIRDYARRLHGISGYLTINPVNRDFLARAANTLIRLGKGDATKKENILLIRYLFIDIDVERNVGKNTKISSTESELAEAISLRDKILSENQILQNNSIWGCSGNGAYILVKLNDGKGIPNTPENEQLVRDTLRRLAEKYGRQGRDKVHIDTSTPASPSAHIGIPGTMKCKGSNTPERPYRLITVDGGSTNERTRTI